MEKLTIRVRLTPEGPLRKLGKFQAVVVELAGIMSDILDVDEATEEDKEGTAYFTGDDEARCLGHAMFYLSTVYDLEKGVKLDITNEV